MSTKLARALMGAISLAVLAAIPMPAEAGCGCQKAPPAPSYLRPAATYPGTAVTLVHPGIVAGRSYQVTFSSGTQSAQASVTATAVSRRDLADGVVKPQVVALLPTLPLGPTAVSLTEVGRPSPLLQLLDDKLTVVPAPVLIPGGASRVQISAFRAAVSRDRQVYMAIDLSGIHAPRVFRARFQGLPLRFGSADVVFRNPQGFLMQRLDESMPGLFSISAPAGSSDSDWLTYSRHEFDSYFLQHAEHLPHAVDATDPNWHMDGTRHIDHDHQIVQIAGSLPTGSLAPGATPPADLVIEIRTLFDRGLFGDASVRVSNGSTTDGYLASTGYGSGGDVASNGAVTVAKSFVNGNVRGAPVSISSDSTVTGAVNATSAGAALLPVQLPSGGLPALGDVSLKTGATRRIAAGSYSATRVFVDNGSTLYIDNAAGPVTLYVTGEFTVKNNSRIVVQDPNPEKFAVYMAGTSSVLIDNGGVFFGVIYAPASLVTLRNKGEFTGSFVGRDVVIDNNIRAHFARSLRGE